MLEKPEREAAKKRKEATQFGRDSNQDDGPENVSGPADDPGRALDRVAAAVGLSRPTLQLRDEGESTRSIAQVLGVSHETVASDIRPVRNLTPPETDASQINDLAAPAVRNLTPPTAADPDPPAPPVLDTVAALAAAASRFMRLAS